jgi:RNA polymerase sigma factor (sigma-70 family)
MNRETELGTEKKAGGYFVTTQWTVVLNAGSPNTACAREALAKLCQTYWYPLYAFVRRQGSSPHDAQDLTQEFFARLLEKKTLEGVTREGGKFRSFLLTALRHFLNDEWKKARAAKRGGGQVFSLDLEDAEKLYGREPADLMTPEKLYEYRWALALLDLVYGRLRDEYEAEGKADGFAQLKFCLTGERSALPYADLAERLGVPESSIKTRVHRLRLRYRELLREAVADTVASPQEVEEELRYLFRALSG